MTDIIETVADAIIDDLTNRPVFRHAVDNFEEGELADIKGTLARAALTAMLDHMRQPSEEAQMAGLSFDSMARSHRIKGVWQAMLNQYKKEMLND